MCLNPCYGRFLKVFFALMISGYCFNANIFAQVHYYKNGSPWNRTANSGPDSKVPGWFYNLGVTGIRVELTADQPKTLLVRYVFADSPAHQKVLAGDRIIGVDGDLFSRGHQNGYGMDVFGAVGPISDFAQSLESSQGKNTNGRLELMIRRGSEQLNIVLKIGKEYGAYSDGFPASCEKTDLILSELLDALVQNQKPDGSFGNAVHNTFAPLALLASGERKHLQAAERCVEFHCQETKSKDNRVSGLINWRYMSAAIVISEYYLQTKKAWVIPELQQIYDYLANSQYLKMSQINPRSKESHPHAYPKGPADSRGGWGHNPGFEGYGPIAMLTGQGALAYSLMHRCGIKIDRSKHDAAYDFLKRASGANGYVWYEDQVGGGPNGWADMGRTGAAGIANFLSPYEESAYLQTAKKHAEVIGLHPESFPDTHGSPMMGMGYTALAANVDRESFRKLMDSNRWWFTLAQCHNGGFYYQPNRDNAGYGPDARMLTSSVVAFIFSIPKHNLIVTGKEVKRASSRDRE